jgi:integrase
MNFGLAIEEFRRYLRLNGYRKNTVHCYIEGVTNTLKDKDLDNLTQRDLDDISIELRDKGRSPNTIRLRHASINLFCKEILKREDLYLYIPRQEKTIKNTIPPDEMERILEAAKKKSKLDYAVHLTLLDEALRRSEVCNLNLDDVNFATLELYLRDSKTGNDIVTMTTRVADAIKDYILYERKPADDNDQALFISKRGKRIGGSFVAKHVKARAAEVGIKTRVHPQRFRTTSITHLLNNKVNPISVQHHARHAGLRQTMEYDRPTQQDMKVDIERVFVKKKLLDDEDRIKASVDKYFKGEITKDELQTLLDVLRPKQLKPEGEFSGYQ